MSDNHDLFSEMHGRYETVRRRMQAHLYHSWNWIVTICLCATTSLSCTERAGVEPCNDPVTVFALGDSLTDGFSLGKRNAYPQFLEAIARSEGICLKTHNGGRSGDTVLEALNRLARYSDPEWNYVIVALGINDIFRGSSIPEIKRDLKLVVDKLRSINPDGEIILAGMQVPAAFNLENSEEFKLLYPQLAQELGLLSIPFLLDGVLDDPTLNLADRLHPNRAGHKRMAENAWQVIKDLDLK